jgi:hypothetical protein
MFATSYTIFIECMYDLQCNHADYSCQLKMMHIYMWMSTKDHWQYKMLPECFQCVLSTFSKIFEEYHHNNEKNKQCMIVFQCRLKQLTKHWWTHLCEFVQVPIGMNMFEFELIDCLTVTCVKNECSYGNESTSNIETKQMMTTDWWWLCQWYVRWRFDNHDARLAVLYTVQYEYCVKIASRHFNEINQS